MSCTATVRHFVSVWPSNLYGRLLLPAAVMGSTSATMRGIKIPTFVQKPRQLAGGRGRLLIDVPIVFAQEKIQFPLRQEEREGEALSAEYLYTKGRQEAHRPTERLGWH